MPGHLAGAWAPVPDPLGDAVFDRFVHRTRCRPIVLFVAAAVLVGATLVGGTAGAAPAGAPQAPSLDITNEACEMTILATVVAGGDYVIEIWDDGDLIAELPFTAAGPGTNTVLHTVVTQPGQDAPGIAVLLVADDTVLVTVDPYLVNACSAPSTTVIAPTTTAPPTPTTTEVEATTTTAATQDTIASNAPDPTPTAVAAEVITAGASYTG